MKKDWMVRESELDDDQIRVLSATLDKSCVVSGCAGSGKSVLALIKAQRIQKERGGNYEIIVYTKALCQYMNSGRKELGLKNNTYYYEQWKNKFHRSSADYVIVDEIQDFTQEEISEFINATKKNFFFFGDTAQSVYEDFKKTMPVEEIGYLLPMSQRPKEWGLYRNYRLPVSVARFVQNVGVGLPEFEEAIYKSPIRNTVPYVLQYGSTQDQIAAIKRIINRNDLEDVAILLPDNESVKQVSSYLTNMDVNHELKYQDSNNWHNNVENLNFNTTNPKVMTYHSAKGLQFETVFLPCVNSSAERNRKALYVAMTRTYKDLYVMYSDSMPDVLRRIPASQYKTIEPGKETIADI